ncbi:MAG TPA: hypothetical protein ENI73_07225, partial [Spirochaetes bacterium]|nr:hypothetical protein [Spirochaetota bacterium]
DKNGVYFKYCGQRFWEFISGCLNLYLDLIKPLGHQAKERNDEYLMSVRNDYFFCHRGTKTQRLNKSVSNDYKR